MSFCPWKKSHDFLYIQERHFHLNSHHPLMPPVPALSHSSSEFPSHKDSGSVYGWVLRKGLVWTSRERRKYQGKRCSIYQIRELSKILGFPVSIPAQWNFKRRIEKSLENHLWNVPERSAKPMDCYWMEYPWRTHILRLPQNVHSTSRPSLTLTGLLLWLFYNFSALHGKVPSNQQCSLALPAPPPLWDHRSTWDTEGPCFL